jgi:DNA-binding transcriptional regulator YhcF (GntR family)
VIIEIDPGSPTPPYEQIRGQLATMIATGAVPPGAHLPSIRQLAADLGIAANTVARAYRELELAGLVASRVRHGTTVTATPPALPATEVHRRLDEAARTYVTTAHQLGVGAEEAAEAVRAALRTGSPGQRT